MDLTLAIPLAVAAGGWFFLFRYGKTSSAEAHRLVSAGARLLDVRTAAEFAEGHLPGAVNIPLDRIEASASELGKDPKPIVVYCASGMRSAQAKRILVSAGLSKVHDLGGINRW